MACASFIGHYNLVDVFIASVGEDLACFMPHTIVLKPEDNGVHDSMILPMSYIANIVDESEDFVLSSSNEVTIVKRFELSLL